MLCRAESLLHTVLQFPEDDRLKHFNTGGDQTCQLMIMSTNPCAYNQVTVAMHN